MFHCSALYASHQGVITAQVVPPQSRAVNWSSVSKIIWDWGTASWFKTTTAAVLKEQQLGTFTNCKESWSLEIICHLTETALLSVIRLWNNVILWFSVNAGGSVERWFYYNVACRRPVNDSVCEVPWQIGLEVLFSISQFSISQLLCCCWIIFYLVAAKMDETFKRKWRGFECNADVLVKQFVLFLSTHQVEALKVRVCEFPVDIMMAFLFTDDFLCSMECFAAEFQTILVSIYGSHWKKGSSCDPPSGRSNYINSMYRTVVRHKFLFWSVPFTKLFIVTSEWLNKRLSSFASWVVDV